MRQSQRRVRSMVQLGLMATATGAAVAAGNHFRGHSALRAAPIAPLQRVADAGELHRVAAIKAPAPGAALDDDLTSLTTYETVYALVRRYYVDKLPAERKLAQGTVKSMINSLEDPNSYFLEPTQRALLDGEAAGRFAGIGAALFVRPLPQKTYEGQPIEYQDHQLVVVAALPGSPAEKAGLRPGDIVTAVDGKAVLGYNPLYLFQKAIERWQAKGMNDDAIEQIRVATQTRVLSGVGFQAAQFFLRGDTSGKKLGAKGSFALTVRRDGAADPITVTLTPATTTITPVTSKTLPGGVCHLKIAFFTDAAVAATKQALASGAKGGIVLDLRGNPGGSFQPAQKIAGLLAGKGTLLVESGPGGKKSPVGTLGKVSVAAPKISVLVDRGTASTAEALAQFLVEKRSATLVGARTFGDAVAQTLYPLPDGSAFTLTTGVLTSAQGVAWAGTGLLPKVALAADLPENEVIARAAAVLRPTALAKGDRS